MRSHLYVSRRVLTPQANLLRSVYRWVVAFSPPTRPVRVVVVPHPAIGDDDGLGFGQAHLPDNARGIGRLYVAAGIVDAVREQGGSAVESRHALAETFLHEWAHYEQWRDRRPITELGVAVRARNLRRIWEGGHDQR